MVSNKSKISIKYFFILSILFFCSCDVKNSLNILRSSPTPTLSPELMDRSWLTGLPCSPPCWYNLKIGKTTLYDAQEKINQLPFIDSKLTEWKNPFLSFFCREQNIDRCVILRFDNNELSEIGIFPNYEITLKDVIDEIGPPDFLSYSPISPEGFRRDCVIHIYWLERKMDVFYADTRSDKECEKLISSGNKPSPTMHIQGVWIWNFDIKYDIPWTGFAEEK